MKPLLALAGIVMKATGVYKEGYIGISSGYFWESFIYNVSITVCLYALAMFWVCMTEDLKPFRPMPKFLCIKGIIFASYWQGLFLSILVWLGAIPDDVPGYSVDNLATAIQDALICFEMPLFALAHWYAFSWHDYADNTISAARLPVKYALRDAFGPLDLIQDTKETFAGNKYDYRHFDARDNVLAHEESSSRAARMAEGMRYERNGKGKYWLPKPGQSSENDPLLNKVSHGRARAMSPGPHRALEGGKYGTPDQIEEPTLEPEDERLFDNARALEFGDWNVSYACVYFDKDSTLIHPQYPVIEAHRARREDRYSTEPPMITASTNRNYLQPTADNKRRRKSQIKKIQEDHSRPDKGSRAKGKQRTDPSTNGDSSKHKSNVPLVGKLLRQESTSSSSANSKKSQLVDLVVEDHDAEEVDRIRARKEGGPAWNEVENKHYVHTYPQEGQAEEVREGFEPDVPEPHNPERIHNLDYPFKANGGKDDGDDDFQPPVNKDAERWESREYDDTEDAEGAVKSREDRPSPDYGSFREERNVWGQD